MTHALHDRQAPAPPRAECTADSAGGLTFDVVLPGGPRDRWDAALLLRPFPRGRPGGAVLAADVRLPLFPCGGGRSRAALPSTVALAEGRWAAYLVLGDAEPVRLRSGRHDLRSLVDRVPSTDRTWMGVRVPYPTRLGNLSLRAWQRWPHAEADDLRVTDGGMTLRGRLYGAALTGAARLEARQQARATSVVARTAGEGEHFQCTLPYAALDAPGVWELWLRPSDVTPAVRVARILDDKAGKRTFPFPVFRAGGHTVTPYYTCDNDLALRLQDASLPLPFPAGVAGGRGAVPADPATSPR